MGMKVTCNNSLVTIERITPSARIACFAYHKTAGSNENSYFDPCNGDFFEKGSELFDSKHHYQNERRKTAAHTQRREKRGVVKRQKRSKFYLALGYITFWE